MIALVNDPERSTAILAERRENGGVVLRQGKSRVVLSDTEVARVLSFIHEGQPVTVTTTPAKARFSAPVAP
jgi:hypothetical protein